VAPSKFHWSRLLTSWLNSTHIFDLGVSRNIVSLKRVNVVDCVCHGCEREEDEFFYVYLSLFPRLHVCLLLMSSPWACSTF